MRRSIIRRPALPFLLALSLVFAPLTPVFAMAAAGDEAQAAPVAHDHAPGMNEPAQAGQHPLKSCTTHDSCTDQYCPCCVHCVGAISFVQPVHVHSRPVQTPILPRLHSFVFVASRDRPPRSPSL